MNGGDALLIFLDPYDGFDSWLHLRGGTIAERGPTLEGLPDLTDPETGTALRIVAVVPGDAVSVHWLELPAGLTPAQAIAAARLMAVDVSAQPISELHVAVGPEVQGEAARAVALVPALTMAEWIGRLQAAGLDPDLMLPEPLLLQRPDIGFVSYERGSPPMFRGANDALAIEPHLAEIIFPGATFATLTAEQFEGGLGEAIAAPAVNLRQGAFARRRRWRLEWRLIRRLVALALGILLATLALQAVNILRHTYAADALEAEANRVAARALPNASIANAPAQLERRLSELGGNAAGYGSIVSAVFAAVRDTPNVELTDMIFDRSGNLRATIRADGPASISAFQARVEASGFSVLAGPLRSAGGSPVAELMVQAQ